MSGMGKLLMMAGAVLFVLGLAVQFLKFGKLPGDIIVRKGQSTFFFPIVSSILASLILTAVLYVIGRFK